VGLDKFSGTMLINLVKDSVLQCFCHSCRAPLPPAGKFCRRVAVRDGHCQSVLDFVSRGIKRLFRTVTDLNILFSILSFPVISQEVKLIRLFSTQIHIC
jgi:hypothetical protein